MPDDKDIDVPQPIAPLDGTERLARHGFGLTDEDFEATHDENDPFYKRLKETLAKAKEESGTDEQP